MNFMSNMVNITSSFARRALPVNREAMKLVSNVVVTLTPENVDLLMRQLFFFLARRRSGTLNSTDTQENVFSSMERRIEMVSSRYVS